MADEDKVPVEESEQAPMKISRRDFLVGAGAGVVVTGAVAAGVIALRPPTTVEVVQTVEVPVAGNTPVPQNNTSGEEQPQAPVVTDNLPATMRLVNLQIDGSAHEVVVDVRESLWETMTYKLGLGGNMNLGCDRAQCGACAIMVDGLAVNGCTLLSARLGRGQQITTVAGLGRGTSEAELHPVQKAFWDESGYQCGICTRGFIMSTAALLAKNPNPTEADIKEALAGNICRCSEYPMIINAAVKAAELARAAS